MAFHFHLDGLLHVRELFERQARERLEQSIARLRQLENRIAEAKQWMLATAAARNSEKSLPAGELRYIEDSLQSTARGIQACELQFAQEAQRMVELRAAYLEARRNRKTVSTLRENARILFEQQEQRREQRALDELFLGKLMYQGRAQSEGLSAKNDKDLT